MLVQATYPLYQNTKIEQQTVYNTTVRLHYEMIKNIRLQPTRHLTSSPSRVGNSYQMDSINARVDRPQYPYERYLCYCLGDTTTLLGRKYFHDRSQLSSKSCSSRNDAVKIHRGKKVALAARYLRLGYRTASRIMAADSDCELS